jgi:hypothetical protein
MMRDADLMAMRGRRLTRDAEAVLKRKGQKTLLPRPSEIILHWSLVPATHRGGVCFCAWQGRQTADRWGHS